MISLLVNCDTRPEQDSVAQMFDGTRSADFLLEGIRNKQRFFDGFELETIVWVDEHVPVSDDILRELRSLSDRLVLSKHRKYYKGATPFTGFNDVNYLQTFALARGDVIVHMDQDMAAFTQGSSHITNLLLKLDEYKYICYPTEASPKCVNDASFGNHAWASTRFFMCRKDTIDLTELEAAIWEPETLYAKHPVPPRIMNWTEHFLGIMSKYSVYYPPVSTEFLVFPWHQYKAGTLGKLNSMSYPEIAHKLISAGANSYHGCDAKKLSI